MRVIRKFCFSHKSKLCHHAQGGHKSYIRFYVLGLKLTLIYFCKGVAAFCHIWLVPIAILQVLAVNFLAQNWF